MFPIRLIRSPALIALGILATGCESGGRPEGGAPNDPLLTFTFPGGLVDSGRVILSAGALTSYDQSTGTVIARMANTGDIIVDVACSCFIEGEGKCFAVEIPGPSGTIRISCAYNQACAGRTMGFCVMTVSDPDGFSLRFRAPAVQVDSTRRIGAGSCAPQGTLS